MIEIMLVNVSTEKDPGLIQIGSTLSSPRVISRFLKRFQKNVMRDLAKTCVESLLRLHRIGSISVSELDPSFSNLGLGYRRFYDQPQCEACVAIFKAALKLGARKVRSRGSDVAKRSLQS